MSDRRPISIALWGRPAAGKTALLAYLLHHVPLQTDPSTPAWNVRPTKEAWDFTRVMREHLGNSEFPPATPPAEGDRVIYEMERSGQRALLTVDDRAGGDWLALREAEERLLAETDGIVLMLDPHGGDIVLEIREMLDRLQMRTGQPADQRPVAICVSKADLLIERPEDLAEAMRDGDRFVLRRLRGIIPPDLTRLLALRCPNHRFFPVSAVGVRIEFGLLRPAVLLDESLTWRVITRGMPINLIAPFEWIFEMVEGRT
jgi:hypothetical protein